MELTEQLRGEVIAAHNNSGGKIVRVAAELGVTWQTARRWLILAGIEVDVSERLDRPGLVWPRFAVGLGQRWEIIVEAPNWAVACEAIKVKSSVSPVKVERTNREADEGLDRASVKALCSGYMDRSLSISDLAQRYLDVGVIVR